MKPAKRTVKKGPSLPKTKQSIPPLLVWPLIQIGVTVLGAVYLSLIPCTSGLVIGGCQIGLVIYLALSFFTLLLYAWIALILSLIAKAAHFSLPRRSYLFLGLLLTLDLYLQLFFETSLVIERSFFLLVRILSNLL